MRVREERKKMERKGNGKKALGRRRGGSGRARHSNWQGTSKRTTRFIAPSPGQAGKHEVYTANTSLRRVYFDAAEADPEWLASCFDLNRKVDRLEPALQIVLICTTASQRNSKATVSAVSRRA
jgi:hypothetical protein